MRRVKRAAARRLALRASALLCALLLALGSAAVAEQSGWREGLSPSKPYEGVPAVDLNAQLGYMVFSPTKSRDVENSCQRLYVYLPRKDVKAGEGLVQLCTKEDGVLWESAMDNEAAVTQREMTAAEKTSLMWGDGVCFEIKLPKSLELGKSYFMNLERGCIWTEDGKPDNPEVKGENGWGFTVKGDYGVSNMEYRRALNATAEPEVTPEPTPDPAATLEPNATVNPNAEATTDPELEQLIRLANGETPEPTATPEIEYEGGILEPQAGDQIRFDLVLGGEAKQGILYGYNGTVDFPIASFEQSGEVTGIVLKENPAWGIIFLDAQGNELHRMDFR